MIRTPLSNCLFNNDNETCFVMNNKRNEMCTFSPDLKYFQSVCVINYCAPSDVKRKFVSSWVIQLVMTMTLPAFNYLS